MITRLLPIIALLALAVVATGRPAAAHPELVRAEPPEDGLLAAPPQAIELWMTERVDVGAGSPALEVLDADGTTLTVRDVRVDPDDARHVIAEVDGIGSGTYTVIWTARSVDDGHTLTGSFAFRVGTGSAPGAATVEGETPQPWAVATRWLTFPGIAVATAGFLYRPALLAGQAGDPTRRRRREMAITAGATVALLATIAEPALQTWFPPAGAIEPSLDEALAGLPNAWWLRLGAATLTVVLSLIALGMRQSGRRSIRGLEWAGAAVALATLVGLSLTSHAAARESWRELGVASDTLHQWAIALWVGGLAQLAISWPPGRNEETGDSPPVDPIRRFSRYALILVIVGAGTGILNAGLALPALRELWESDYGRILIVKATILVPVLVLATFHRVRLRHAAERIGSALRPTVRLEAAMALLVVLGGSILALMAPPATATGGTATLLDLAAPLVVEEPALALDVRLQISPAKPGDNEVTVFLTDAVGAPVAADQIALVRLNFQSLNYEAARRDIEATANGEGGFVSDGLQFSLGGWWRMEALVRRLGVPDGIATFYFILPDPNVHGFDAPDTPESSDEAKALFERGMASMASLKQVRYLQQLGGGGGNYVASDHLVDVGENSEPPATALQTDTFDIITIGERRWLKRVGEEWREQEAPPIILPAEWGSSYEGATGFQLGPTEEVNGETAQMASFVVPGDERTPTAWFAWWVGTESGQILREAMVSRSHYMVNSFVSFNEPLNIEPPASEVEGTPAA